METRMLMHMIKLLGLPDSKDRIIMKQQFRTAKTKTITRTVIISFGILESRTPFLEMSLERRYSTFPRIKLQRATTK